MSFFLFGKGWNGVREAFFFWIDTAFVQRHAYTMA